MFPLHDTVKTRKFPVIIYALIALNLVVFFMEIITPDPETFITTYALVPVNVNFLELTTLTPFVTSQFLHAGFIHILSNLWFLRIFGDNVEEKFGSLLFLIIYLISGALGGLAQYIFSPSSAIPMLGASGAVAGVLGAYLVFFPRHKIETLVPFGFFMSVYNIPASIMLIYWFIIQLFSGVGSIAVAQTGGVAFWAHVGGFATGWLIARLWPNSDVEAGEIIEEDF